MALVFTTTDQASAKNGVKCLGYSDAGFGKTKLCSTAPAPIILSAESGLLSLKKFKIPVITITGIDDLYDAYRWVTGAKEANQFATVCLDSISEIGEVVLANAKKTTKDPRQAYGELIEKMQTLIRAFRDLQGKHVFFAAKQEPVKDEMSGVIKYGPSMPGSKLGPQLPYFFDEVFCIRIGKTPQGDSYRYLQTQPDLQFIAKDRSGALDMMEPPDLSVIFNKILGA